MTTLRDLVTQLLDVEEMEGEVDDQTLHDTLDGIEGTMGGKIDAIAGLCASWAQREDVIAEEIRRLQKRKRAFQGRRERLKGYLAYQLGRLNKPSFETDLHTVSLRKGRVSVVVDDVDALPAEYQQVKVEADKNKLKAALAEDAVEGAHLETGDPYVVIR